MSNNDKILIKIGKQVYNNIKNNKVFEFDFPDYAGLSKSDYHKLSQDHIDAIQAAVYTYERRSSMTVNDFVSLAKDEYANLVPEHEKTIRPVSAKHSF